MVFSLKGKGFAFLLVLNAQSCLNGWLKGLCSGHGRCADWRVPNLLRSRFKLMRPRVAKHSFDE